MWGCIDPTGECIVIHSVGDHSRAPEHDGYDLIAYDHHVVVVSIGSDDDGSK